MDSEVGSVAAAYVAEHYPLADLGVVGGSAANTRRSRSDIDLLVIGPARAVHANRGHRRLYQGPVPRPALRHSRRISTGTRS